MYFIVCMLCIIFTCEVVGSRFMAMSFFFFQAEDGIRDLVRSRGLGDVYKRQGRDRARVGGNEIHQTETEALHARVRSDRESLLHLSLIHI